GAGGRSEPSTARPRVARGRRHGRADGQMERRRIIGYTALAAVALGLSVLVYYDYRPEPATDPSDLVREQSDRVSPEPEANPDAAPPPAEPAADTPPGSDPAPGLIPTFDVVRVEPGGETVIAG